MADIVRIFEDYCDDQEYYFGYGTTSIQNLLTNPNDYTTDKVHLLLEPVRRKSEVNNTNFGFNVKSRLFTGKYMLVLRDNFDLHFFNEKGQNEATSKYSTRIEPLLTNYALLEKYFMACEGLDLVQHDNFDVTDALDANMTGLIVNFQFRQWL
jgi:hypothetical protein